MIVANEHQPGLSWCRGERPALSAAVRRVLASISPKWLTGSWRRGERPALSAAVRRVLGASASLVTDTHPDWKDVDLNPDSRAREDAWKILSLRGSRNM